MSDEFVVLDVETVTETDMAVLFNDGDQEFWVPKSLIDGEWPDAGDTGSVMVQEWFAVKEGLV